MTPMRPDGVRDDVNGIRQFTVGTGGEGVGTWTTRMANSAVIDSSIGVLKLTLHADSYDWQFVPAAGYTFTDSGSGTCH
jgi:hypothetical protein